MAAQTGSSWPLYLSRFFPFFLPLPNPLRPYQSEPSKPVLLNRPSGLTRPLACVWSVDKKFSEKWRSLVAGKYWLPCKYEFLKLSSSYPFSTALWKIDALFARRHSCYAQTFRFARRQRLFVVCLFHIIGSAEALPILCVRCARWERERERDTERERERKTEVTSPLSR